MLTNHDTSLAQHEDATKALEARQSERAKFAEQQRAQEQGRAPKRTGILGKWDELTNDPQRGAKLDTKVAEAEKELAAAKAKCESICSSIHHEVATFHQQTNADFSLGLHEHIRQQLAFEEQQQKHWRHLLAVFEQIETMPHSGGLPGVGAPMAGVGANGGTSYGASSGAPGDDRGGGRSDGASAIEASFALAEIPSDA